MIDGLKRSKYSADGSQTLFLDIYLHTLQRYLLKLDPKQEMINHVASVVGKHERHSQCSEAFRMLSALISAFLPTTKIWSENAPECWVSLKAS